MTLVVVALLSGGCVNRGGSPDDAEGAAGAAGLPSPELGRPPASLPTATTVALPAPQSGAGGTNATSAAPTTSVSGPNPAPETTTTTSAPATPPATVLSSQRDGADVQAPAYADLRALAVERIGSMLRVTVEVGGEVPGTLQAREVIGLGIDFSRRNQLESDVQLFVDGGESGWRAYLQGEDGFVAYPGTFALGGNRFVLEVPAEAFPNPPPPVVSAFLDWSTKSPVPSASSDAMPDNGLLRPTP